MVMIETFPRKFLKVFYVSLGKIAPVRILMKVPSPEKLPPGLPENIHISSWMPQVKILSEYHFVYFISAYCNIQRFYQQTSETLKLSSFSKETNMLI